MQVLLLVLFLTYLYVPYLLFKFFVEESIDLDRRRDVTRVEEFFAAAMPSTLLNGFAYLAIRLIPGFPRLDWHVAAALLDPRLVVVRSHIGRGLHSELGYLSVLYLTSCVAGWVYGRIELTLLQRGANQEFFLRTGSVQRRGRWFFALLFRRIWLPFFAEAIGPLVPWTERTTWLFIRTNDDRLYYGRMHEYIKNGTGDIDSIVLSRVQRYSRRSVQECVSGGKGPLTRLSGTLLVKWSDIRDVNVAPPSLMLAIRRKYALQLRKWRKERRFKELPHTAAPSPPEWPC
jgi:hypothetical protein